MVQSETGIEKRGEKNSAVFRDAHLGVENSRERTKIESILWSCRTWSRGWAPWSSDGAARRRTLALHQHRRQLARPVERAKCRARESMWDIKPEHHFLHLALTAARGASSGQLFHPVAFARLSGVLRMSTNCLRRQRTSRASLEGFVQTWRRRLARWSQRGRNRGWGRKAQMRTKASSLDS